jgi:3-deoxy-D-manno-octulosonic-acid transferase
MRVKSLSMQHFPGKMVSPADRAYDAVASAAFPLLWLAAWCVGTSRRVLRERTGALPAAERPLFWFHGASAGEMGAAAHLAATLRANGYCFTAAYTAANDAGVEFISQVVGPGSVVAYAPGDAPRWVARAYDAWKPRAVFLIETELWPGLIRAAWHRSIPIFSVSARVYARDVARYRLIRSLTVPMLRRLTAILAQNEVERARFVALGADPHRCVASGNLKHIGRDAQRHADPTLRDELGLRRDEPVIVFGTMHRDEIRTVFAVLDQLRLDNLRAIIAPRHRSGIGCIARESHRRHWRLSRRTGPAAPDWQILVLDRMGELPRVYGWATVAVVGGGLGRHGGHNPFEPVMAGTPVLFGAHFEHFEQEALALAAATPAGCPARPRTR